MLVLSRKVNQSIIINDMVEVKIISVRNGYVKLGINAPRKINVHRKEVYDKIKKLQNKTCKPSSENSLN